MRWVVVLLVVLVALTAFGRIGALPGVGDSAGRTEQRVRDVAQVLEDAAAAADDAQAVRDGLEPSDAEARWTAARNDACTRRAARARRLERPRTVGEMATFARAWLALDAAHDRRVAALRAPGAYAPAARRLARFDARQERGLHRVAAAAERGDSSAALAEIAALRGLAARAHPTVAELGLTACFFPTAGLPY